MSVDTVLLKHHVETQKRIKDVTTAFNQLIDMTNVSQRDEVANGLANALLSNHPTLIQSFFSSLSKAATMVKDNPRYKGYDGRCIRTGEMLTQLSLNFDGTFPYI